MIIQGPKRIAFFLPNTFTALNMACGFSSIIFAIRGQFYIGSMILLLGAIFDMVDGRVARLTGTQSAFGEQFDSISDVISFGMAPALLLYMKFFVSLGRVGLVISFIYLLCGALRLARFNANIDKISSDYFQGLPIPGAALAVIGFVLCATELDFGPYSQYIAIFYSLFFSFLMISSIPFASFKDSEFVKKNKRKVLALIFLTFALILLHEQFMILCVMVVYVLSCLVYAFVKRKEMSHIFDWNEDEEE
ncbi:CDP-diacylglycerol--serine O-phosphatidyltransferase [Bacteriovorax sp. Seq25_V]|uniref:CDP-diacylglycerol--serine O-phosphatidyltransferase n=1 Tax=Bacteriovorax sp. Seq25_V TaxID=1201288 RepID=UPI00038A44DC|nr:CDP-diacylglycerol--serine O-phosphatidyltransferase [Bacteriovorax sp. Seq25_V]EQC44678.1 CDP-diacylglycerol-serine O-phosphatidyltransferase [Bacteriovorax sp. Seq25_V]